MSTVQNKAPRAPLLWGAGEPRFPGPLDGRLERVRKRFAGFGEPAPQYLASLSCDEQLHCGPIEWVELDRWHIGRVVLIGDAAHAGPSMIAREAVWPWRMPWVMAEVLCEADRVESALDTYASRRRQRVEWVQQQSRAVEESFRLSPTIRNAAFGDRGNQMMQSRFGQLRLAP